MNDQKQNNPHWSFWAVSLAMLIYNLAGVMNFITQMDPDNLAAMPDMYRTLIEGRPVWATGAFGVAVFGGAIGCVLLLIRKAIAYHVFLASLVGAVLTLIHGLGLTGSGANPLEFLVGNMVQLVVTVFLIWYARWTKGKGWIS
jgi:hypothetical protein